MREHTAERPLHPEDEVGDRACDAVGRIGWARRLPQPELLLDHEGHLVLRRVTPADDRLLDLPRRVLVNLEIPDRGREEDGAPHVPEDEEALHVLPVEEALDGDGVRGEGVEERLNFPEDLADPVGEGIGRPGADNPALDEGGGPSGGQEMIP